MRSIFIISILLLFVSLFSFGQSCDTIDGQKINCIDNNGLKQGFWKVTKKILLYSSNSGYGSKGGCQYNEVNKIVTLAEGFYKDNKKIDTWKYFHNLMEEQDIAEQGEIETIITYLDNGNTIEENFDYNKYKIEINSDTTFVNGNVFLNCDTVKVSCNGNDCKFILSNGQEFLSFTKDKFDYEFFRLIEGIYNREIRIKKNAH